VGQFEKKQCALLPVGIIPKPRKTATGYWLLAKRLARRNRPSA